MQSTLRLVFPTSPRSDDFPKPVPGQVTTKTSAANKQGQQARVTLPRPPESYSGHRPGTQYRTF